MVDRIKFHNQITNIFYRARDSGLTDNFLESMFDKIHSENWLLYTLEQIESGNIPDEVDTKTGKRRSETIREIMPQIHKSERDKFLRTLVQLAEKLGEDCDSIRSSSA